MSRVEISEVVISGNPLRSVDSATVRVNHQGGTALATVYEDAIGADTLANPLTTDIAGRVEGWLKDGSYDLVVTAPGLTSYTQPIDVVSDPGVFNAKSYGAVGDDAADDTTAIQEALDAADAVGGTVYLPAGIYKITTYLTVGSDTTLCGTGAGSVIKLVASSSTDAIRNADQSGGNSRVVIRDIKVLGPEDGTMTTSNGSDTARGIYLKKCTDSRIVGCHVSRVWLQGIQIDQATRVRVSDNTVMEIKAGNGISVDDSSVDVTVENNTVKDTADCAIGTHNSSVRTLIEGNTITNTNFGRGIDVYGAPDTMIVGNTIREVGGSGSAARGIQIAPGLSGVPHRCSVIGNSIVGCAQSGILIDATVAINDIRIVGNEILTNSDHGIYVARLANRLLISGNNISGNTGIGVYLEHSGADVPTKVFIDGNIISANTTVGIQATSSVTALQLGDNYLAGNTNGPTTINLPTVVATGALTLPTHWGLVQVTGNTNITSIVTDIPGRRVTLLFTGTPTVTDGSNLKLAGNFVAAGATNDNDTISLVCDGTNWVETGRSTN